MDTSSFYLQGLAFLGIAAVIAITIVFGVIRFSGKLWGWVFSTGKGDERARPELVSAAPRILVTDPKLTATHILAIKSNLDAVSRQLADLELKLRSHP